MNFILDGMLGSLARWLRMIGQDVKYATTFSDSELLKIAKEEKRVLLTRDLALCQQAIARNIEVYYVEGITETQRLSELAQRFNTPLTIDIKKSRCPKCNTKLQTASKEKVSKKIKVNTLEHYNCFWECLNCGAVYWQGAHWPKIQATLEQAKKRYRKKE